LFLLKNAEKQALQGCYASLSARERQVMALVSSGLINKQVGGKLGISEITVKAHRGQVMQKMHADSFADLVKMAGEARFSQAPRSDDGLRSCRSCSLPRRSTPWKLRIRALAEYRIARWSVIVASYSDRYSSIVDGNPYCVARSWGHALAVRILNEHP
jgi:DNA-binding CsgD family transcriptional regulator